MHWRMRCRILSAVACRACLGCTKAQADRIAASSELGILVASCGFKASAPELYVREQLTFKVCSMWYLFLEGMGFRWSQSELPFPLTRGKCLGLRLKTHLENSTLLHANAVVISLPVYRRHVCLLPLCGFKVIDQSGSCKFSVNGLISCADDSNVWACRSQWLTLILREVSLL